MLVLFGSMADYVMLTSPFGGGDPSTTTDEVAKKRDSKARPNSNGRTVGKDDFGAAELLVAHKVAHPAMKRMTIAQLSKADQALLSETGLA